MRHSDRFHLEDMLLAWQEELENSSVFTRSDVDELKSHLLDIYENMLEKGLEQDEAFTVAVRRLGKPINLENEFAQTNQPAIQTRRTILLIAGIILYYCSYYLALVLAKLLVITGNLASIEMNDLIRFNRIFLIILLVIVIFLFNCLIVKERFLLNLLEKIHFKPRHAIIIAILTLLLAIIERCLLPILHQQLNDTYYRRVLSETYMYFEYSYMILLAIGFVVLYFRYFKQTKGPQV